MTDLDPRPELQIYLTLGCDSISIAEVSTNESESDDRGDGLAQLSVDDTNELSFLSEEDLLVDIRVCLDGEGACACSVLLHEQEAPYGRDMSAIGSGGLLLPEIEISRNRRVFLVHLSHDAGWGATLSFGVSTHGTSGIEIQPRYKPPKGAPPACSESDDWNSIRAVSLLGL
ncbi:MAG: hypothetical protein H6712_03205 [Myxococcales bacterium]|nr:hypothetical protein [Myxococcales bacterium]MCB9712834.1 hypothetical protein [Myxococcales bacterium]